MPNMTFDDTNNSYTVTSADEYDLMFLGGADELLIDADGADVNADMGDQEDMVLINSSGSTINVQMGNGDDVAIVTGDSLVKIDGGAGVDRFEIFDASNVMAYGGEGNDIFHAGGDIGPLVVLSGGEGNDSYHIAGDGTPSIVENSNEGFDTVFLELARNFILEANVEELVTVFEAADTASYTITAKGGTDNVIATGGQNDATIWSGAGNDVVVAAFGDDQLFGEAGNDALYGGAGSDVLVGGLGRDMLTGNEGADVFRFDSVMDSKWNLLGSYDSVTDYEAGVDMIDLHNIDANANAFGNQAFSLVGASTGAAGQLWVKSLGGGDYRVFGDVDGGGADFAVTIHMLGGGDSSDLLFTF